jgi:2-keto-4-pentenoate hydratase/2-oxohepta-3-ene-1,7-dioic acid hydratase in catechol pathway
MRLATWTWGGRHYVGSVSACGRDATPLALAEPDLGVLGLIDRLSRGESLPPAAGARLPVDAITLRAPLPRPRRGLFCVGRNYRAHAAELAGSVFRSQMPQEDKWPIVFTKLAECVVGPYDAVRLPDASASQQIDYESELAVIIGRGGRDIPRSRAMDHVFGYTVVDDVTARDVQMRHQQWDLGKSFDTFCPMGPWIVTADEMDGRDTRVRGWVNGELRQDGSTLDMIFDRRSSRPAHAASRCCRATSSRPARRPAWAWGSSRRAGCARATWCASRSTASARSRTGSPGRRATDAWPSSGSTGWRWTPAARATRWCSCTAWAGR